MTVVVLAIMLPLLIVKAALFVWLMCGVLDLEARRVSEGLSNKEAPEYD